MSSLLPHEARTYTYEGARPQIGGKEEKKNVRSIVRRRKKIERHCKCAKREGERDYIVCCRE